MLFALPIVLIGGHLLWRFCVPLLLFYFDLWYPNPSFLLIIGYVEIELELKQCRCWKSQRRAAATARNKRCTWLWGNRGKLPASQANGEFLYMHRMDRA
ncbi:hypothetical protein Syun_026123 [Stephania yunnanensis]|uniref:Uncharacterized protein n=1 Tax=Stephania yunnanensis TaxID=152371 RepID=A0AAP0EYE9_9MAGN